jgi:hypothetical protein
MPPLPVMALPLPLEELLPELDDDDVPPPLLAPLDPPLPPAAWANADDENPASPRPAIANVANLMNR